MENTMSLSVENILQTSNLTVKDINRFRELFCYRSDVYALQYYLPQQNSKDERHGYSPVCAQGKSWGCGMKVGGGCGKRCPNFSPLPLDDSAIRQHLEGSITLGAYLVKEDRVKTLIFDFDAKRDETLGNLKAKVNKSIDALSFVGISSYVEFSGNKGYHVWVFFSNPVKASISRRLATIAIEKAGLSQSEVEVFPKQDQTDSFGNLVKLPLGIHKRTGKRCEFLDGNFEPVSDQLQFLNQVQTVDAERVEEIVKSHSQSPEDVRVIPTQNNPSRGLPCVRSIWEGVGEGDRDECAFFLARQLKRNGIPQEFAEMSLVEWDLLNQPPLGSKTISEKLESAYKNDYAALDCDNPHINQFCSPVECPVKIKKSIDSILESIPTDLNKEVRWTPLVRQDRGYIKRGSCCPQWDWYQGFYQKFMGSFHRA